ncbi:MAG: bifunctional UDP-N-acetylglucosamine diphosphorylase/glucosamine-1-phosphate N-acetyltransferase GlmU [Mobiluncus porci]|uniref:bifunctional UDP-N-acetylglucosamine diphosphorylase/glucosamine-1-phosphate N-acetyltransferase GlmU n=1 Tax=Mobiluncus TaxID=2050 RepID=UPI0023F09074|nr:MULTISPECIES: bifunctional UDP-N-acetylglucosamine diphosphorylase/glucosamine-1-phosphate N-acetyltransferase GlmU [Mobiluncus]MCI6584776.1 bifunctional UDP-N-acetylglucosamine diphosphorylase/glucosamine-1-phosphate N-acetyltransferase GlmU [Mobiluncus sp.]MDD7542219.1 bifunctional UDP-N-acetylglucosamine diphosphorylase/glucosamine-1-phosphate N-acetyltransferase GlmU [Mobiluncus porci]MDY5747972.1 bifunctional UDP-N-acetylglucosamine diphosphorylase/glucosamine-1-phosphate N-acetyltransfe
MTQVSTIVILAAGQGTRMKSKKAKVLHSFAGRTLLSHAIHTALEVEPERIVLVVRHQRDAVAEEAKIVYPDIIIADQDEVPGTGRAVWCALEKLKEIGEGQTGTLVVTSADVPLMESSTILSLAETREDEGSALCLLTTEIRNPFGYGRIQRVAGQVAGIIEERDATYAQKQIKEVNAGIYAFDAEFLATALPELSADNSQGEIYLTDTIKVARNQGRKVSSVLLADTAQAEGCNDRAQLAELRAEYNRRRTRYWMLQGVTIIDPTSTWIDADVTIGMDTTIYPNTQLRRNTVIGEDCRIGPDSTLIDVTVGDGAEVLRVHGISSSIGPRATIGPFTYLRPGTNLAEETKVGGFCETKNIEVGRGTKIPHLSYVGDATIGEGTNIGAATIFANYDGVHKHHSNVGSYCRTGADNIFIAPVNIGDGVYTGGGTIVRHDIPSGALAVNQFDMRIIPDWVVKHRPDTDAARAAQGEFKTTDTENSGTGGTEISGTTDTKTGQ